ncbi:hypothetical protein HDV01_002110 [Terramyces sp. JEL0728]|nr:hypothetical protein HDV01_002110 [Terramyces sp. JEL0728]
MPSTLLIDILLVCVFSSLLITSGYNLFRLNLKPSKSFYLQFTCVWIFNMLQCAVVLSWIIILYVNYDLWTNCQLEIFLFSGVVASCQLLMIFLTDVEILRVFSILNEKITSKKLLWFRASVMVYFVFVFVSAVLPMINQETVIEDLSDIFLGSFAGFVVIYDNVQSFVLVFLIYKYKSSKAKGTSFQVIIKQFSKIMKCISFVLVMDWIGIFCYAMSVVGDADMAPYFAYGGVIGIAIHNVGMVSLLKMFAKVSIQKKKANQMETINAE